jgi:hypothetical protein
MRTAVAVLALASLAVFASTPARAEEGSASNDVAVARSQVDAAFAQMRATSFRVREQLRTTRKRGTAPQITCVDEALSRSDVALRRARELGDEALAAYGRGEVDEARAGLRRVAEMKEVQRVAASAATSCTPSAVVLPTQTNTTTVRLEIAKTIAPVQ